MTATAHPDENNTTLTHARVGVLGGDSETANNIQSILKQQGHTVTTYNDPENMKQALVDRAFDLVIVDLLLPNCPLTSAMAVEEFLSHNPADVPAIMLSGQADLSLRLVALRAGIKAYLTKPVDDDELLTKINDIIAKHFDNQTRVLVVDDDPMLTEYYDMALSEEGCIVQAVNDPLILLEEIDNFKPDVITLDYMMPGCNGLEVAEILRGDPRYMKIPIIFMSSSEEAIKRKSVLSIFGNAFLEKPVEIDELNEAVREVTAKSKKIQENFEKISIRTRPNGIENRDYFLNRLRSALEEEKNQKNDIARYVVLATLDNANTLRKAIGPLAMLRLNDNIEEFFAHHSQVQGRACKLSEYSYLLLLDNEDGTDAETVMTHFRVNFSRDPLFSKVPQPLSLSMGAMDVNNIHVHSTEDCIQRLENACITAANAGGDRTQWITDRQQTKTPSEKVFKALKARTFQLAFQSIVRPDDDTHIFEVLLRLEDEDGEIYTPEIFLPHVEDTIQDGSYQLDRWVIENAFRALENTSGRGAAEFSIIIKLSPNLQQAERLMPFIYNIVSNTRLRGLHRIYFSLHEDAVLNDLNRANKIIKALAKAKCGIVMEHCSASDSCIEAIKQLETIDFIKLQPSLTTHSYNITNTRKRIEKLREAIGSKGEVIASLVEDAKTFAQFWDMDIRFFQGFFIHKPHTHMDQQPFESENLELGPR